MLYKHRGKLLWFFPELSFCTLEFMYLCLVCICFSLQVGYYLPLIVKCSILCVKNVIVHTRSSLHMLTHIFSMCVRLSGNSHICVHKYIQCDKVYAVYITNVKRDSCVQRHVKAIQKHASLVNWNYCISIHMNSIMKLCFMHNP